MRSAFYRFCLLSIAGLALQLHASAPNVLFISVDDLKPLLSNYGDRIVHSPNFDRLAAMGVTFTNAHCQQAVCGPSRASLMTGLRPDQTRVWDLHTKIRDERPEVLTIPQHFKNNGYTTLGIGKIFDPRSVQGAELDDPDSWSRAYLKPAKNPNEAVGYLDENVVSQIRSSMKESSEPFDLYAVRSSVGGLPPFEGSEDVPDTAYTDGRIAAEAAELIHELAAEESPFFLGVGFYKPHLPFNAPKRYWDLYSEVDIKLEAQREMPVGAPAYHFQPGWEIRNGNYSGVPPLSAPSSIHDDLARTLIHGYYACVSYIDAQLGLLLDALEASGEAQNTVIVLWGDHGWHLGDHGIWCKHTNYEQATRTVYMICDLRVGVNGAGRQVSAPVELVVIFATPGVLAGLDKPAGIEGMSLRPLLAEPEHGVKAVAVSQFPRAYQGRKIMGYAWRSERYRYIEWIDCRFRDGERGGETVDVELYDYDLDPLESRNLIKDPFYQKALFEMRTHAREYKQAQGWDIY